MDGLIFGIPVWALWAIAAAFLAVGELFTPGLFARMKLVGSGRYHAMMVPDRAIGTDQDRKFVLVLKPDTTVEYRSIQPGRLVDGLRVVTSGLKSGDRVVINGLQRIRPGMKVAATLGAMVPDSSVTSTEAAAQ